MNFVTDHIPHYRTYADWARHEASVKPIRGRTFKPIARRKDWYMHMTRGEDGSITLHDGTSEEFALRVTYNPDNTLIISNAGLWANVFRFIEATTGLRFRHIGGESWLELPGRGPVRIGKVSTRGRHLSRMTPLRLRKVNMNWELLTEVEPPTYYKLDVRAWNNLRKRLAPYLQQLELFCKIRADTYYERRYILDPDTKSGGMKLINPELALPVKLTASLDEQLGRAGTPPIRCMETEDLDTWVNLNVHMIRRSDKAWMHTGSGASEGVTRVQSVIDYAIEAAKREWRDDLFTLAPVTKPSHRLNLNAKYFA